MATCAAAKLKKARTMKRPSLAHRLNGGGRLPAGAARTLVHVNRAHDALHGLEDLFSASFGGEPEAKALAKKALARVMTDVVRAYGTLCTAAELKQLVDQAKAMFAKGRA